MGSKFKRSLSHCAFFRCRSGGLLFARIHSGILPSSMVSAPLVTTASSGSLKTLRREQHSGCTHDLDVFTEVVCGNGITLRFCLVGFVKASFACVNHAADCNKRLFSHSVCCRRDCAPWSVLGACLDNRLKKEDCLHWHDMDTQCSVEFRFKLSTYSLFGPHRCCADHFPRIPARFRVDYTLFA